MHWRQIPNFPQNSLKIVEIGQGSRPCGATLYQKVEILHILGAAFPTLCTDRRQILHSQADPGARRSCKV